MNPDTIVFEWTGKFDLNTLRVDEDFFESEKKKLPIQKYRIRVDGRGLNVSEMCSWPRLGFVCEQWRVTQKWAIRTVDLCLAWSITDNY